MVFQRKCCQSILYFLLTFLILSVLPSLEAQSRKQRGERRSRAAEHLRIQHLNRFVEDVHLLYETSGELVSYRVRPEMTPSERKVIVDRSKDLDKQASRIISYIEQIAPYVKGNTDDLWVITRPWHSDEIPTLDDRLTLIMALVYRVEPKLNHLVEVITGESEPAIELDVLQVEASLPFLVVGGLEFLKDLTTELRRAL